MDLKGRIQELKEFQQIRLAIDLLLVGLKIWKDYADNNPLEYVDSVVAMHHKIDDKIIEETIAIANDRLLTIDKPLNSSLKKRIKEKQEEFLEPITALEDWDWEIPEEVKLMLFSANNLLEKIGGKDKTGFNEPTIYVSINQSIDSITRTGILTVDEVKEKIKNAG